MYKRFLIIICCLSLTLFFSYSNTSNVELIPVMAVPTSNKVIIIDAGHGTPDERSYK